MFCPKCGKETDALGKFCQWCGADIVTTTPLTPVATPEEEEMGLMLVYMLALAGGLSPLLLILFLFCFGIVAAAVLALTGDCRLFYGPARLGGFTYGRRNLRQFCQSLQRYGIVIVIIPWLYYAGFESSRSQATPGKLLMRIVVTDLDGNKPSFARVTLRHFAKFISALIIFIGFLMIGLTKNRQGLHDKIAGCLVLLQD